ncbi:hypothetical protein [Pedobacter jamesrossensis]|uniref:Uncharacterized protein n=1 Tax=Pedobacter jamesrossensis TaxID=1908238 RepID=A0ABV8NLF2_9SPHI
MIELDYFLKVDEYSTLVYQVIQFSAGEPWRVVADGILLGSLEKLDGKWRQLSGDDFSLELFSGVSALIDEQHFNDLPLQISSRWPNLISEVLCRSDQEYLVVCKAGINFRSFEGIFSRFVSGLLKDEWPVSFKVFNHDFSQDFSVTARPGIWKKNMAGWGY